MLPDMRVGYEVILKALEMPLRQIAQNAGVDAGVVVEKVREAKGAMGYDAVKNEVVDMLASGIVDPVKVTRTGLERAASAAAILLTTEAAIAEEPEEKKDVAGGMPDMGGMGGMDF
jgi:chaperonin GroEL